MLLVAGLITAVVYSLNNENGRYTATMNGEYTLTKLSVVNGELKTETTGAYPGMPENVTYTLGEIIK